jgi:sulfur carrier protein
MKKKIKIKLNGRSKTINENSTLLNIIKNFKVPLKKVAIELNQEIVDKKKLEYINLKQNDKIEIVHFIGGG